MRKIDLSLKDWLIYMLTGAALFVSILGLPFLHVCDYSIAVDSMSVSVNPDDIVYTAVEINNGLFFDEDISLRTESVSPYIHVDFEPDIVRKGDSLNSKVNVLVDKEVAPGEYIIPVISSSSDGKEHKCTFKLKVPLDNTPIDTPTKTQSGAETPTETPKETVGIESLFPFDIFVNGLAAGFFMVVIYSALFYLVFRRNIEFAKPLIGIGILSYIGYLYFSWRFCTPAFEIFSDIDIFVVQPLSFVLWATLFLIVLPIVGFIIAIFQSLG